MNHDRGGLKADILMMTGEAMEGGSSGAEWCVLRGPKLVAVGGGGQSGGAGQRVQPCSTGRAGQRAQDRSLAPSTVRAERWSGSQGKQNANHLTYNSLQQ